MLEISYRFYHHQNPSFPKEEILKAIQTKDFETFNKYYLQWSAIGKEHNLVYIPTEAFVWDTNDYSAGVFINILDRYNFARINEYFCEEGH